MVMIRVFLVASLLVSSLSVNAQSDSTKVHAFLPITRMLLMCIRVPSTKAVRNPIRPCKPCGITTISPSFR